MSEEIRRLLHNYRRTGDVRDFWPVILLIQPTFARFFHRRLANPADAEDLFQGFVIRVIESRDNIDPDHNPGGWLYAVADNIRRDHFRREHRRLDPLEPFDERAVDRGVDEHLFFESLDRRLAATEVRARLASLSAADRALVKARWFEQRTRLEMAALLNRSPKSVKKRLERLAKILPILLAGLGKEGPAV